jgi:penicillin-binding protein 1B
LALKVKIPRVQRLRNSLKNPFVRAGLALIVFVLVAVFAVFSYYYIKYEKLVDQRMSGQIFANTAKIYAQPRSVRVGQKADSREMANYLRHAGYTEAGERGESKFGTYRLLNSGIEVKPGKDSYYSSEGASVRVRDGKVDQITSLGDANDSLSAYDLEPQLVTGLFDSQQRSKRRVVKYDDIPRVMVDAVTSIEDRRFFYHGGVNYWRIMHAAWIDFSEGKSEGGSTITMQTAKLFFLSPEKRFKRKVTEMLIALELEQRFSKKQIFELYANQVDMGQRGSFTIRGFGEAAQAYFAKDLNDINLQEAALLAGLLQHPSMINPYHHPERALDRRNTVLESMVETGAITREEADKARAAPLKLAPQNVEASDAPYFVDMIREQLLSKYNEEGLNGGGYRIYTTLDPSLQKVAAEAVEIGIKEVDGQIKKLRTRKVKVGKNQYETKVRPGPVPQVALIAIDPHTGDVLALVGGRNYGFSQVNHATASRPTGSIFKPFVYAAAVNTAVEGDQPVFTPATVIDDSPTAFPNGDDVYTPRNYGEKYWGLVSAQFALSMSLNNATVKVAEMTGYEKVAALAKSAGIVSVKATPAMALGSYDATPMDMASAYTVFANGGQKITTIMVKSVRDVSGDVLDNYQPQKSQVLDPRVAFVVTTMMQGVINSGTAVEVRSRGFTAPAAGKTGSSHDAWFAGFTSNLLCIVWVGYDDYTDIKLSGAKLALPVWTEFMKRATALPGYSDVKPFAHPAGVVQLNLDRITNQIATPACPNDYTVAFIEGTEPTQTCEQMPQTTADGRNIFQKIFGRQPATPPAVSNGENALPAGAMPQSDADKQKKRKGFWGRLFSSKDSDKDDNSKDKGKRPEARSSASGPP